MSSEQKNKKLKHLERKHRGLLMTFFVNHCKSKQKQNKTNKQCGQRADTIQMNNMYRVLAFALERDYTKEEAR